MYVNAHILIIIYTYYANKYQPESASTPLTVADSYQFHANRCHTHMSVGTHALSHAQPLALFALDTGI